ncbi:MAG: glutamine amidotransferase [Xenophilus sp.]
MKTAIALRHVHFEDVDTLHGVLTEFGYTLKYLDPATDPLIRPDVQEADLLIVLGGPIGAYDEMAYPFLADELSAIQSQLHSGKPLLGICLGAQLIARALGAKVYPMGVKEIGFSALELTKAGELSVLADLGDAPVLHWHGDQFDIPEAGVRLAGTAVCPNQAFAVGHHVLGLQFHLEADPGTMERWLIGHACELGAAGVDPRMLRADAQRYGKRLHESACQVMRGWLTGLEAAQPVC